MRPQGAGGGGQRRVLSALSGLIFGQTGTMEQNLLKQWPPPGQTRPISRQSTKEYRDCAPVWCQAGHRLGPSPRCLW